MKLLLNPMVHGSDSKKTERSPERTQNSMGVGQANIGICLPPLMFFHSPLPKCRQRTACQDAAFIISPKGLQEDEDNHLTTTPQSCQPVCNISLGPRQREQELIQRAPKKKDFTGDVNAKLNFPDMLPIEKSLFPT